MLFILLFSFFSDIETHATNSYRAKRIEACQIITLTQTENQSSHEVLSTTPAETEEECAEDAKQYQKIHAQKKSLVNINYRFEAKN